MPYCPKCGAKVEDGDLYCYGCGYKLSGGEPQPDKYRNYTVSEERRPNYETNHGMVQPLSKVGFILSLIAIGLFVVSFLIAGFAYESNDKGLALLFLLSLLFAVIFTEISLGLSIPGLIITRKREYRKGIAVAALILAIIAEIAVAILYVYAGAIV